MNLTDFINLTLEDKIAILVEEGEFLSYQKKDKEIYSLFSFYIIARIGSEDNIESIFATNNKPAFFE
jgi:hypothetical protein